MGNIDHLVAFYLGETKLRKGRGSDERKGGGKGRGKQKDEGNREQEKGGR